MTELKSDSWLVLDIGNTHTVAGIAPAPKDHSLLGTHNFSATVRFRTDAHATSDEYQVILTQLFSSKLGSDFWRQIKRVIVSSVVPTLEKAIQVACSPRPTLMIHSSTEREFELLLPFPEQLGADRLANVAGALLLSEPPFLIVDAGTATTFCLVDRKKRYIGGAISPGLEIGWKALQARAAKLFSVELIHPENTVGNTTETQLQTGVLQGYECLIEGLSDRLVLDAQKKGDFENPVFFATGGITQLLKLSPRFRSEPDLTLIGLLRYGQLNPERG